MSVFLLHNGGKNVYKLTEYLQIPHGTELPQDSADVEVIIHWDEGHGLDGCFQYRSVPVQNIDLVNMERRLRLHGFHVTWRESLDLNCKNWIIPVFHLEALAVFERDVGMTSSFRNIALDPKDRSLERLIRIAIQSVYSLGLDFAIVVLSIQPGRKRYAIRKIIPAKHWTVTLGKLYALAINRFAKQWVDDRYRSEKAVLGMDPEFILCRSNGTIVSAERYFSRHGRAGCDAVLVQGKVVFPLVELRPQPDIEPHRLIHNLKQTMNQAANKFMDSEVRWIAGGMPIKGLPLGGHIHLSRIWLNSRLLRVLDNYLALPLMMIEDENSRFRRPRYGTIGDFQRKSHGGFEYRTLPSWIVSPTIAKGVIALVRLIADHYKELNLRPLHHERIQTYFYEGEKRKLLESVHMIWKDIEQTSSYTQYQMYLDPLKKMIMSLQSWNSTQDFRMAWKIPPFDKGG